MTDVWDDSLLANPHAVADKAAARVRRMFAAIAPSYDLNNRLHSLWMDQSWRRRAVRLAQIQPGDRVVDVACGTGDLTLAFVGELIRTAKGTEHSVGGWSVPAERLPTLAIGIDFTFEMLPLAQAKTDLVHYFGTEEVEGVLSLWDGWRKPIVWLNGDAQNLPLGDACCDVASIAFGIRNVVDPLAALKEFFRILRPGDERSSWNSPHRPIRCFALYIIFTSNIFCRERPPGSAATRRARTNICRRAWERSSAARPWRRCSQKPGLRTSSSIR